MRAAIDRMLWPVLRRMIAIRSAPVSIVLFILFMGSPAFAAVIYMSNGPTLRGIVIAVPMVILSFLMSSSWQRLRQHVERELDDNLDMRDAQARYETDGSRGRR